MICNNKFEYLFVKFKKLKLKKKLLNNYEHKVIFISKPLI